LALLILRGTWMATQPRLGRGTVKLEMEVAGIPD
jgi:hypothetical protein